MPRKGGLPAKTFYTPRRPEKYVGTYPIVCRSSWELMFCQFCDTTDDVLQWASESVQIPYLDPLKPHRPGQGANSIYVPDFLIHFRDASGRQKTWLIEIKPMHEAMSEHVRDARDAAAFARNQAKWLAAAAWCQRRGIELKILTEADMFYGGDRKKLPKQKKPRQPRQPKSATTPQRQKLKRKMR
jgi:hypothetical protein